MTEEIRVHSTFERQNSSDSEDIGPTQHEYSLVEVEPHYAVPGRRAEGGDSDDEGGIRRMESPNGSVSDRSAHSRRDSIKARDSDDDVERKEDDVSHRHDVTDQAYEQLEELAAYDKVLDELEDNYYNQAMVEKERESEGSDGEEGIGDRSGSRNSKISSEVKVEEYYEEIPGTSERKDDSGSEEEREAEYAEGHYENSRQEDSDHEGIYAEVDVREYEEELREERRDSRSSDSDKETESERRRSSSAEDAHDGSIEKSPATASAASGSSGKFVLRTVRNADPLHVLRNIRNSDDNNPETDELVTILRTGKEGEKQKTTPTAEQKAKQEKLKSFITSKLVNKFEQGIDNDLDQLSDGDDSKATVVVHHDNRTTVVKATVKEPTPSPLSPMSPTTPKSPQYSSAGYQGISYASHTTQHQKSGHNGQVSPAANVGTESPKTPTDGSGVPTWKAEIETRKKTKNYVQPQKPKEPLKMFEVPEWKKQLQEKNKAKKKNSEDTELTISKILLNPSAASLPLKVEMDRLKRDMASRATISVKETESPEWARIADEMKKPKQPDINGNI